MGHLTVAKNLVAHRATSLQYLVAQTYFLVVPGVRTPDLSGPESLNLVHSLICARAPCGPESVLSHGFRPDYINNTFLFLVELPGE